MLNYGDEGRKERNANIHTNYWQDNLECHRDSFSFFFHCLKQNKKAKLHYESHFNFIENTVRKKIILQNIQCNISNKGKKHITTAFHKKIQPG